MVIVAPGDVKATCEATPAGQRAGDVPAELLTPRDTSADGEAYDRMARRLDHQFHEHFATFADSRSTVLDYRIEEIRLSRLRSLAAPADRGPNSMTPRPPGRSVGRLPPAGLRRRPLVPHRRDGRGIA